MNPTQKIKRFLRAIKNWKYKYIDAPNVPNKLQRKLSSEIRKKDKIRVAFILYDIAKWRTEELYLRMLEHPRFDPVIVPVFMYASDYSTVVEIFNSCIKKLQEKGYSYIVGCRDKTIDELVNPDIVFYGEHYSGYYDLGYTYQIGTVRNSLGCYVPYSMHNTLNPLTNNQEQSNLVWMAFVENQSCKDDLKSIVYNHARNKVVTGIPMQDEFLRTTKFNDFWKKQDRNKKRIIWAPSHNIAAEGIVNIFNQSMFLDFAEEMLILAEKYKEQVQWVFKPHPILKRKLTMFWGKERTNEYYKKWENMSNTQLEEGQYIDLFMTSDAMIHDCMSFMVEYMFTEKPIMFLNNGQTPRSIFNTQTANALDLHYKGNSIKDIENFIQMVVMNEEDSLKLQRMEFKQKYLVPPHGKTAVQNMINAILGIDEYQNIEFY